MRVILEQEVNQEVCNAAALGAYNALVDRLYHGINIKSTSKEVTGEQDRRYIARVAAEMGLDLPIDIKYRNLAKNTGGHLNHDDGIVYMNNKYHTDPEVARDTLAHELTHLKQTRKGELKWGKTEVAWKNEKVYTAKELNTILRNTKSKIGFSRYKNLPWEREAYDNGLKFSKKYKRKK